MRNCLEPGDKRGTLIRLDWPKDAAAEAKFREWQKEINDDPKVREFHRVFGSGLIKRAVKGAKRPPKKKEPFLSVTVRSGAGTATEVYFPWLSMDDVDVADELMRAVYGADFSEGKGALN